MIHDISKIPVHDKFVQQLTLDQYTILLALKDSKTQREAAKKLNRSYKTINKQLKLICKKYKQYKSLYFDEEAYRNMRKNSRMKAVYLQVHFYNKCLSVIARQMGISYGVVRYHLWAARDWVRRYRNVRR